MSGPLRAFLVRDGTSEISMSGAFPYLHVKIGDQDCLVGLSTEDMLDLIECLSQRYDHAVMLQNKKG